MDKHIFEKQNRIAARDAQGLEMTQWKPPTIDEAGHLVIAQPRENPVRERSKLDPPLPSESDAIEAGRQEGLKLGKQEGYAAGKQEGLIAGKKEGKQQAVQEAQAEAKKQLNTKLGELNKLLTSLANSLNKEDYKLEQAILNLVKLIAKAVIKREMQSDPGQIMKIIKEVIAALPPSRDNIKIRVNPHDKKTLDAAIECGGENWQAIADEEVSIGGCHVETAQSLVDYSTELRFQHCVEQIVERQLLLPQQGDPEFEEAPEPVLAKNAATEKEEAEADFETQAQALQNDLKPESNSEPL